VDSEGAVQHLHHRDTRLGTLAGSMAKLYDTSDDGDLAAIGSGE